ncbi:MAG: hypothetical protein ABIB04_01925 [Patescibacteria group bacterium]
MQSSAYAFIYDEILNDQRFERELAEIEARLTALDIQGRVGRLALFRNAKDLIDSMVHQGVNTIVIVGDDQSFDKTIWFLPDLNITVGYLPITGPSRIAELLGIPTGADACDVLAARLIETIDLGKIEDRYFLTEAVMRNTVATVDIEGRFRISASAGGSVAIRNLGSMLFESQELSDAKDGLLEVIVTPLDDKRAKWRKGSDQAKETKMFMTHGEIISPAPIDVMIDRHMVNGFNFKLKAVPNKLRIITGRGRRLTSGRVEKI